MPNPLVAATSISVGGGLFGAREAGKASDRAVAASDRATQATIDESGRQFDQVREDTRVARETGNDALMTLGFLLGVRQPPSAKSIAGLEKELADAQALKKRSASAGQPQPLTMESYLSGARPAQPVDIGAIDKNIAGIQSRLDEAKRMTEISTKYAGGMGDFIKSQPGYQFGLDEGANAMTNVLTASGQSQGGKALKAAERYGIDYAGSKTDEHLSRLFTLAGYGPAGVNTSANAGANYANTVANANAGHAGVVGDAAYGNAAARVGGVNNAINTGVSLWSYNDYMNRLRPPTSSTGSNMMTIPQGSVPPTLGRTA